MKKLAIIGSGISGMASAYYLRNDYDITIFEKESYLGGHTNTIEVEDGNQKIYIDTGFIVYNETTYPNLTKLFDELGVETQESSMSFSLYNMMNGLQFCGSGKEGIFAQHKNIYNFQYWRFILQIMRFFRTATKHLTTKLADLPLGEYLKRNRYNKYFIENYIVPMSSAIWSTPMEKMMDFPARTLIQFFNNHGLLGISSHHQWKTVAGGSHSYIKKIVDVAKPRVLLNSPVVSIFRDLNGVVVCTRDQKYKFDKVLIASHANQALAMLKDASEQEKEILTAFQYQKNKAILHTDDKAMPPLRTIWSAWNYKISGHDKKYQTTTLYYMNRLQKLKTQKNYFVSVNEFTPIAPEKILYEVEYEHPLFDLKAIEKQKLLPTLHENGKVFFAGSYFRFGFHEDGLLSAIWAAEALQKQKDL